MIESPLQMARRHVAEQEARIVRQRALIARLARQGHPTVEHENLLRSMEDLLVTFSSDLERLQSRH